MTQRQESHSIRSFLIELRPTSEFKPADCHLQLEEENQIKRAPEKPYVRKDFQDTFANRVDQYFTDIQDYK